MGMSKRASTSRDDLRRDCVSGCPQRRRWLVRYFTEIERGQRCKYLFVFLMTPIRSSPIEPYSNLTPSAHLSYLFCSSRSRLSRPRSQFVFFEARCLQESNTVVLTPNWQTSLIVSTRTWQGSNAAVLPVLEVRFGEALRLRWDSESGQRALLSLATYVCKILQPKESAVSIKDE